MAHLLTHEDARFFRVHALCGLYCLLHFLYRLFLWLRYRSFLFDGSLTTPLSLAPHALLAFSALQFRLPLKRNPLAPMLNPEWRAQTIAFSFRSIAVLLLMWWSLRTGAQWPLYLRGVACLATSAAVDALGAYFSRVKLHDGTEPGKKMSLMREMPWPKDTPEHVRRAVTLFYSVSQLFATGALTLGDTTVGPFFVLGVIQISGFLSTLARKAFITSLGWHRLYFSLLAIGYPLLLVPAAEWVAAHRKGAPPPAAPVAALGACLGGSLAKGTWDVASLAPNGSSLSAAGGGDLSLGVCRFSKLPASSTGVPEAFFIVPVTALVVIGRLRLGVSKYALWGAATAAQWVAMRRYGLMDTVVF